MSKIRDHFPNVNNLKSPNWCLDSIRTLSEKLRCTMYFTPANLENVFRGTYRVKKRDLPAKSGTVGRAHIDIYLEVGPRPLYRPTAYRNQLRSKIHCSTAIRPR